ncbi:hypothetical protein GCM10027168_44960 [Streptomyces capparidis]
MPAPLPSDRASRPGCRPESAEDGFAGRRVAQVLRGLSPSERALALTWAEQGLPWAEAAMVTGLPAAYGERVRRKLKRLGARCAHRATAAAATARRTAR